MKVVLGNQFKNEEYRIEEWIYYNKALGIKDFILINDNSTDKSLNILNSIKDVNILVIQNTYNCFSFNNSSETEIYKHYAPLHHCIANNFKKIHEICLNEYGSDVYLGFFDVDEFIFYKNYKKQNISDVIRQHIKNNPVLSLNSLEVDSDLFSLDGKWLSQQTTKSISYENKDKCTRALTVKSFQNLSYFSNKFYQDWGSYESCNLAIHHGGLSKDCAIVAPSDEICFLHYRYPMYDIELNKKYCIQDNNIVKEISNKAKEIFNENK